MLYEQDLACILLPQDEGVRCRCEKSPPPDIVRNPKRGRIAFIPLIPYFISVPTSVSILYLCQKS